MHALNLFAVFVRDQVRGFPPVHRWLTDFIYTDMVKNHPPVLSIKESIDLIVRDNASVARYGDGEYKLCRNKPLRFQRTSKELAGKLREILYCEVANFHAAVLPPALNAKTDAFLKNTLVHNYRIIHKLDRRRLNSFISHAVDCQSDIDAMKQIWQRRKVTLITNADARRMAADCNLFDNASQWDFIEAPNREAFAEYESIVGQAKRKPNDTLFLLACGPTATVLAYDLHLGGYRAVDIGQFISKSFDHLK